MDITVVHYYGLQNSGCGYCKNKEGSISHGMQGMVMSPQDYQALIDRGWRRSGCYCYKPNNKVTCCPLYTIKCSALDFKLSKSNKKVLKRMNRFLHDGKKDTNESENHKEGVENGSCEEGASVGGIQNEPKAPNVPIQEIDLDVIAKANADRHANPPTAEANNPSEPNASVKTSSEFANTAKKCKKSFEGSGVPQQKKAKQMRLERREAKLAAKGIIRDEIKSDSPSSTKTGTNEEKTLADYINAADQSDKHVLKIVLVPSSKLKVTEEVFQLYRKYQLTIHNDNPSRVTPTSLQRFLFNSPLQHIKSPNGPSMGYGSFHQQYWLDDKLIAVGVIDILPTCVSSVYFFYDPDYSFLSLGTYGSLREIDLVHQLASEVPSISSYYMGFYIHSCPKMRYKGKLVPSYLLCPETYTWHLLTDDIRKKLDVHKYQRFNPDPLASESDTFEENHLDLVPLLINNKCITLGQYTQIFGNLRQRDRIFEYGRLVGKTCSHRMMLMKS